MNIKNRVKTRRSFVWLCLRYFILYSLSLAMIYIAFSYCINARLNNALPSMDSILKYEDELKRDRFSDIPPKINKNCSYIIFDSEGKSLYASSKEIAEGVSYDSIRFIREYSKNSFYSVSKNLNSKSELYYTIYLIHYDDHYKEKIIDSATVDAQFNIIEGDLFDGKERLTKKEFHMLNGRYSPNQKIEKYEYETVDGEKRVLVGIYPLINDEEYSILMKKTEKIWFLAIPLILDIIIIQTFFFARKIKKSITYINDAINAYMDNEKLEIDKNKIPNEFHSTVDGFNDLLNKLNTLQMQQDILYKENQQVITDISHDLKTPLTVIQGYSKAFRDGKVPEDKKDKYLETIYEKSVLSSELIDSLFEYVKMEHPDYKMSLTQVDLSEYITEVLAEKYSEIEENGFNIHVDIAKSKIPFFVDKKLFKRLFENLIGNCLKHNPKGTTIFISLKENKKDIVLTVADDGIGIPGEIAENIFKPFVTSNNARSSGKGTGLGLTIAKKIVELHNGTISLSDSKNSPYSTQFLMIFHKDESN